MLADTELDWYCNSDYKKKGQELKYETAISKRGN